MTVNLQLRALVETHPSLSLNCMCWRFQSIFPYSEACICLHLRATLAVDKTGTGGLDHFNNTTTQMSTCFFAS